MRTEMCRKNDKNLCYHLMRGRKKKKRTLQKLASVFYNTNIMHHILTDKNNEFKTFYINTIGIQACISLSTNCVMRSTSFSTSDNLYSRIGHSSTCKNDIGITPRLQKHSSVQVIFIVMIRTLCKSFRPSYISVILFIVFTLPHQIINPKCQGIRSFFSSRLLNRLQLSPDLIHHSSANRKIFHNNVLSNFNK